MCIVSLYYICFVLFCFILHYLYILCGISLIFPPHSRVRTHVPLNLGCDGTNHNVVSLGRESVRVHVYPCMYVHTWYVFSQACVCRVFTCVWTCVMRTRYDAFYFPRQRRLRFFSERMLPWFCWLMPPHVVSPVLAERHADLPHP